MHRPSLRAEDGFSLVEILVVILIISILAAIALPAFLGQRSKAQDAEAKAVATTATKAMAVYASEHDDLAGATPGALVKIEASLAQAFDFEVDAQARTFTVTATSRTGDAYSVQRRLDGGYVRDCTPPGQGSCAADADARGNRW